MSLVFVMTIFLKVKRRVSQRIIRIIIDVIVVVSPFHVYFQNKQTKNITFVLSIFLCKHMGNLADWQVLEIKINSSIVHIKRKHYNLMKGNGISLFLIGFIAYFCYASVRFMFARDDGVARWLVTDFSSNCYMLVFGTFAANHKNLSFCK